MVRKFICALLAVLLALPLASFIAAEDILEELRSLDLYPPTKTDAGLSRPECTGENTGRAHV